MRAVNITAMSVWKYLRVDLFFNFARYCTLSPSLSPLSLSLFLSRLYSSRKLFGRTRKNNNGNDCEIKAAYRRNKNDSAACFPSLLPSRVFSFYTDDRNVLALFFSLTFFCNAPVNTFASTIDGIRRTLTVVNGETLNAILNRAIVNNRRCSMNRLEMGQNNLRRERQ